ncbi:MAG: sigma-70 family RNA polymerase sigma factor [Bacteroidota bacterium]
MTELAPHFFRRAYSRLVAQLSRRIGAAYIEDIEDAVQTALQKALESWVVAGVPPNPDAWLYRVAHNEIIGALRQAAGRRRLLLQQTTALQPGRTDEEGTATAEETDLLRMLFVCCDPHIPEPSQLVFALKILCGFSAREIALRLFTSEANVYKRLTRARNRLRENPPQTDGLTKGTYTARLPAVHRILYLLFTEGYLSGHAAFAIREELCNEALRLASLLVEHPVGQVPETYALLALMELHAARMTARQDAMGGLLLLEEQDRSRWDKARIGRGLSWLAKSAAGGHYSRYHAEAGVAAAHCMAPSFEATQWDKIVGCYELLEQMAPSAIHRLNLAVAMAEWKGADAGLAVLKTFEPPTWLTGSYLWVAVMADLHRRIGNVQEAARYREEALKLAPTPSIKTLLERRLQP